MHGRSWRRTLWCLAVVAAAVWHSPSASMQQKAAEKGGQEEFGPVRARGELAEAAAGRARRRQARRLDLGIDRRRLRGDARIASGSRMRGELPLPAGAKPWTPYGMLNPSRGNATGNTDGLNATCEPAAKRGWERRCHHVDLRAGSQRQSGAGLAAARQAVRAAPCGRGPHKIKMSPVRSREARLGHRRPAARDLQVHL